MPRRAAALALSALLLAALPAAVAGDLVASPPAAAGSTEPDLPRIAGHLDTLLGPAEALPAVPSWNLVEAVQAWDARIGVHREVGALDVLGTLEPALAADVATLLSALYVAAELRDEAFAAVTLEELLPYALGSEDPSGLAVAAKVDRAKMARAAHLMAVTVDATLPALQAHAAAATAAALTQAPPLGLPVPVTPAGAPVAPLVNLEPVLVMDPLGVDNLFDKDAALVIDLGGDDVWDNNAGGGLIASGPVGNPGTYQHVFGNTAVGGEFEDAFMMFTASLAIDVAGDDQYGVYKSVWSGSRDRFCTQGDYIRRVVIQGAGSGGLGMLVDVVGDDRYDAKTLAQGHGHIAGVGVQVDMAGNDAYTAIRSAMGTGILLGAGMFLDALGHDTYTFRSPTGGIMNVDRGRCDSTQRLGLGTSVQQSAALFIEGAGDDTYRIDAEGFAFNQGSFFSAFVDAGGDDDYGGYPGVGNGQQGGGAFNRFVDV